MQVLVTGGAGYLGSVLTQALLEAGHSVRVLDSLMHGGRSLTSHIGHSRFEWLRGDVRDADAVAAALRGVRAVVHLAAIVGDPACARAPDVATAVNLEASLRMIDAARRERIERFVFASTCSNYGRMADTSCLATEDSELRPLSRYAETKVGVERALLAGPAVPMAATVLRFATLFGTSPRMRFDLTVNEFVLEMLVHRQLTVYGESFWRPYVHVRDAAGAILAVLTAPAEDMAQQVFNVGRTDENYRKSDLISIIANCVGEANVELVSVAEDPRDYRVSFDRIATRLGYIPSRRVVDGVSEIATAMQAGVFGDLADPAYSNVPRPSRAATGVLRDSACVP